LQRLAIFPLLGPALVLYLIAEVASARGSFTPIEYGVAAIAVWLSLSRRGEAVASDGSRAAQLVGWLGLCSSIALLRLLNKAAPRLSVDIVEGTALAACGAIVIELALTVPDALALRRFARSAIALAWLAALACALLSAAALGPIVTLFGRSYLVLSMYAYAPAAFAVFALALAAGVRVSHRRAGLAPEVIVANSWGVLGLALPLTAAMALGAIARGAPAWLVQGLAAIAAYLVYAGHALAADSRRRMLLTYASRDSAAIAATVALIAGAAAIFGHVIPDRPLARALWVAGTLFAALGLFALLRQGFVRAFVPEGGQLLDALRDTRVALGRAPSIEQLLQMALASLRAATGKTWGKPLVWAFDPAIEAHVDAAGAAHLSARLPHPALLARVRAQPGDLIVTSDLADQLVRQPALRPLYEVLIELDALCVAPLVVEGELEGALLLPRAGRRSPLAAEEQRALWELARYLGGLLAVFSSKARAERRADEATAANARARAEVELLRAQVERLQADRELLQAQRPRQAELPPLVAYSAPQRELYERLKTLADEPANVLFLSEPGVPIEPLARVLRAGREAPFVVFDCASGRAEQVEAALFGGAGPLGLEVGCLRVAANGMLLLLDVPALPLAAQGKLARALGEREAATAELGERYEVRARIVASARRDIAQLAQHGRFDGELARELAAVTLRVPPLRECGDDLASLTLLAIDRACRRHGRGAIGIDAEALAELRAYDFPGNHQELEHVIDRAVAHARGARLTTADFTAGRLLAARGGGDPFAQPLEQLERQALVAALIRADYNKSEAARLLGLPRSTLNDKLRRHQLEDHADDVPRPN
jgi:DNA-binding NtrC family response regulator